MALPQPAVDPTAVSVRRVIATLVDAALVVVPAIMLLTASFEYLETEALDRDPQQFCDDYMDGVGDVCLDLDDVDGRVYFAEEIEAESSIVLWGGGFALLVVLQGLTGWTPGKLLTGIRTVGEDGRRPGLLKAFLRWVMWVVDGFPYAFPLLGGILALTTQGHRRVGDMVAKTFVVRARAAGAPIVVPGMEVPAAPSPSWTSQPVPVTPTEAAGAEGWAAPGASAAPAATATQGGDRPGPQWDPARGTYIQWDPIQRTWLQWDETGRRWSPIPGQ